MKPKEQLKIWLSYVSYPVTTAAYWESALRTKYNVLTVGPQLPHEYISSWNLENLKAPITAHNIDFGFTPDFSQLRKELSDDFLPDLYLWVESVHGYYPQNVKSLDCPTACYLIDSHIHLKQHIDWAKDFDYVFVAQREYLPDFKKGSHENIFWLPLGADPKVHSKKSGEKIHNVGFVGSVSSNLHERRANLLNKINEITPVSYKRCFDEEMAEHFSQSKLVFNNAIKNDLNMRVFEAMSIGSCLLTDQTAGNGQEEMFRDGEDYVLYEDDEILEKVDYYLKHDDERERIAAKGEETIRNGHTYLHRVEELLDVVTGEKKTTKTPEEWRSLTEDKIQIPVSAVKVKQGKKSLSRSFVIPVIDLAPASKYNIKTLLEDLADIEGEVIVVFNSIEMYEQFKDHPRIDQYAVVKMNVGVARGWNIGLDIARGAVTFVLNSDLKISKEPIETLERSIELLPEAAIVGPQGSFINYSTGKILHYFEKGTYDKPLLVDDVSGFLFALKTELYNSGVIHFDSQYTPCYSEEWDAALQCKSAGLKTYIVPTDGYDHIWGGSVVSLKRTIHYYDEAETAGELMNRHKQKFIKKWQAIAEFDGGENLLTSYWVYHALNQARALESEDKNEEALTLLKEILVEYPNHAETLEYLGTLNLKLNNINEALLYFTKIEKQNPNYRINRDELAEVSLA